MVHQVTSSSDMKAQLEAAGDSLVVVDFYATWCGPCKAIAPQIEAMSTGEFSAVKFLKVDVDECEEVAMEYNITAMPTFIFIKNGKKVDDMMGANPDKLKSMINNLK